MSSQEGGFRAGLVQLRSAREVPKSIEQAVALIRQAAAEGADYIQTPENTNIIEPDTERLFEKITPEEDTSAISTFAELAKSLKVWLHIGSLAIKVGPRRAANRAYLFAPDGAIVAKYDKIHMFDVNLPSGETYRESATFEPGQVGIVAPLPWGMLGIATCYDLRFPEQFKAMAQAGAKFLTAPSAFTKQTGEAHWHVLLRARAIETGSFVFAAAQGGRHASGRTTFGHSIAVSPWGEILGEAGVDPGIVIADVDVSEVEKARGRIPVLDHTRPIPVNVMSPYRLYETAETGA